MNRKEHGDAFETAVFQKLSQLRRQGARSQNEDVVSFRGTDVKFIRVQEMNARPKARNNMPKMLARRQDMLPDIEVCIYMHEHIVMIGEAVANSKRVQLLAIFLKCALAIIFNTYNIVMFTLRWEYFAKFEDMSLYMGWLFYAYYILNATMDVLVTIICFSRTYDEIGATSGIVNQLTVYVKDENLQSRLCQFAYLTAAKMRKYSLFGLFTLDASFIYALMSGTTTYIIILMQYGDDSRFDTIVENSTKPYVATALT